MFDKFIPAFVDTVQKNFEPKEHIFVIIGKATNHKYRNSYNILEIKSVFDLVGLCKVLNSIIKCEKIIVHGISHFYLVLSLCFMPWIHKKLYWVIWGGDLYYYKTGVSSKYYGIKEVFRKFLISRLRGFISIVKGDFDKACNWYNAKGKFLESFVYTSNIYSGKKLSLDEVIVSEDNRGKNILIGNSASKSNNHQQVFELLSKLNLDEVENIYCPLSYGPSEYALEIKLIGENIFGDKFVPIMEFMPLGDYNKILDDVDIAIFGHDRQQAMGNIINLVGRGKMVFISKNITSFEFFTKLGVNIRAIENLSISTLSADESYKNNKIISEYFCEKTLVKQLNKIFES
ncbi:TDP-N-acetylfucosamine:lipid II N-acetylfucosaminyltransferase [Vibrio diabolicus]|nr:TDP-N-acetylfucosamine:lipid II N-acetylfucosaminyltransferase [Vibrio diabolicus]